MKPIIAISAGGEHSLILSSQGQVFSFGCGGIGQLGGGGSWSHRPEPIKQLKFDNNTYIYNYVITSISAGNFHSLLLDDQGRVFACGANDDGRLGLGDRGCRLIPTLIKTTHKINEISAGGEYSLLSDHKSRVYSTGNNEHGQLGLGGLDDRLAPILIEKLSII
jgi:alpha-tubulin suppressor-like RCC1 family protein